MKLQTKDVKMTVSYVPSYQLKPSLLFILYKLFSAKILQQSSTLQEHEYDVDAFEKWLTPKVGDNTRM